MFNAQGKLFAEVKHSEEFFSDYNKHSHFMLSLSCIEEGELSIEHVKTQTICLHPQQIAVFNPHQIHQTRNMAEHTKGYWVIYFDQDWCLQIHKELFNRVFFTPITVPIIESKYMNKRFLELCQQMHVSKDTASYEKVLKEFLVNVFHEYCDVKINLNDNKTLVDEVKKFILEHGDETITLEDIAKHINYSKNHIIRVFKQEYG
ncbi:MAG: helix-turn-helix transcriptional regulator, partial [Campylobacterota bacterium]|nr:helix-turn-helix transcriptional regulator [Campylobacterota bacterium]